MRSGNLPRHVCTLKMRSRSRALVVGLPETREEHRHLHFSTIYNPFQNLFKVFIPYNSLQCFIINPSLTSITHHFHSSHLLIHYSQWQRRLRFKLTTPPKWPHFSGELIKPSNHTSTSSICSRHPSVLYQSIGLCDMSVLTYDLSPWSSPDNVCFCVTEPRVERFSLITCAFLLCVMKSQPTSFVTDITGIVCRVGVSLKRQPLTDEQNGYWPFRKRTEKH